MNDFNKFDKDENTIMDVMDLVIVKVTRNLAFILEWSKDMGYD